MFTSNISLLTLILTSQLLLCCTSNPGVKVRVTKKAIDYANSIAQAALNQELNSLRIPDQSGSENHFSWSLSNIQNRGVTLPTSGIVLNPTKNSLDWSITNLGLSLKADWRIKYKKGWAKVSTSGSVDVRVQGASVSVAIATGKDATGRPTISSAGCSAHIADVHLDFHGGTGWLINLFRHPLERKVEGILPGQICNIVNKEINVDGESKLKNLKVTVEMAHKFLLDYRLTTPPVVTAQYLETQHKGEVYWLSDQKEAPFSPLPIPANADVSKMFYIWLTEYTANSYAYAGQSNGFLSHGFDSLDLPPGNKSLLNTTCSSMCIGTLIPQIGRASPNSVVHMQVKSTVAPSMNITSKTAVLNAQGNIEMNATTPNKTDISLLTLNMSVSLTLSAKIEHEKLIGQITSHRVSFDVIKSNIGKISSRGLNMVLNIALDTAVIPQLNKLAENGFALPVSGDVTFVNTSLQFLEGSLLVATDLKYNGNSLFFTSERH